CQVWDSSSDHGLV
nr:immunoglobulin light chain junction region [Macaca mulatta]MPN66485.1 immunoglobulin light chain junction region [Macaca mulatta]MPN66700.1 immunoglobulin light chain junction region [Macaca mulatta]MPN67641.1 immunoglobulin light chain junction region [Macaca mulatta]